MSTRSPTTINCFLLRSGTGGRVGVVAKAEVLSKKLTRRFSGNQSDTADRAKGFGRTVPLQKLTRRFSGNHSDTADRAKGFGRTVPLQKLTRRFSGNQRIQLIEPRLLV